jgi:hypothetical protein
MTGAVSGQARIPVVTTLDDGDGSLRRAIITANWSPGVDTIVFNIPGPGPHSIRPATVLPMITDPVVIDGYSQPGATPNTNDLDLPSNAVLMIELDGTLVSADPPPPSYHGLVLTAGGSTVRGLVINRFTTGDGIRVWGDGGNRIEGNFIGTDATGLDALGNNRAVTILDSPGNTIGGSDPAARNILSGNEGGVWILDAGGVENAVQGNFIGVGRDGWTPLGNTSDGVILTRGGAGVGASRNLIGGSGTSDGNVVAFNGRYGVFVQEGSVENAILSNSIFSNGSLGISLGGSPHANDEGDGDDGANRLQNYPVPDFAIPVEGTTVAGTLSSAADGLYTVQLFSNESCGDDGYGQGRTLLGSTLVTTDPSGSTTFLFTSPEVVALDEIITATATDSLGNTSAFSTCAIVSDFRLGVLSVDATAPRTGSLTYTVAVEPEGKTFDHAVALSCRNLPEGGACTFSPEALVPGDTGGTSTLTVTTDATTPVGPGSLEVVGTFQSLVRRDTARMTVSDFTVSVEPTDGPVTRGESIVYTVAVAAQGGEFDEAVTLTCKGAPADVTCTFSPATVTPGETLGTSVLTIGTGAATPTENVELSVVGAFGTLESSASLTLQVVDFSLSVSPPTATVVRGETVDFEVAVETVGASFDRSVSLGCSGLPLGSSCSFSPATLTPGEIGATATMTVSTASTGAGTAEPVAGFANRGGRDASLATIWGLLFLSALVAWRWSSSRKWVGVALLLALAMSACGDDSTGTKPETVTFSVSGTDGISERSAPVTLTIQ